MRTIAFAKRNLTELSRDVLGYIFCIIFPIVMMVVMSVVNSSIPKEAGMTVFRIDNLAGGIMIFGQTFVMLFTAILVATDKNSSFLTRLFSSPMTGRDFTLGYILPMVLVAGVQAVVTGIGALIIAGIVGVEINPVGLLLAVLTTIPSGLMFIAIGLIFGTLLNEKSAPGVCSVIISAGTFLGGVFFDAEGVGGTMFKICRSFPFLYCTRAARCSIRLDLGTKQFAIAMAVTIASGLFMIVLAVLLFTKHMKSDK